MNKLKLLRIESGLSQFELSFASSVPRYVIQLAERGIRLPTCEHISALAEVLGVPFESVFGSKMVAKISAKTNLGSSPPNPIRAYREMNGLAVEELADMTGIGLEKLLEAEDGHDVLEKSEIAVIYNSLDGDEGDLESFMSRLSRSLL